MSQTYVQLSDIGILHRTHEVIEPRWRQDDVYKLVLCLSGSLAYETPLSKPRIRAGQFLLFNPGDKHQQLHCDGDKLLVEFSPTLVNEITREVVGTSAVDVRFRHAPTFHRPIAGIVKSLIAELAEARPGQRLMLEHSVLQLFVLAVRSTQAAPKGILSSLERASVRQAVTMMMECYRDALTLEAIAKSADMSKFSLIRQFREATGLTPYEWLVQYRVHRACEALLSTKGTVLDIALNHGFQSVSAFNREFRRIHGMSPTKWRQLHQEGVHTGNEYDAKT